MNHLINFSLIIILGLSFICGLSAQKITKFGPKYFFSDAYTFEELGPLMKDDPLALIEYNAALEKGKKAKINGLVSISLLAGGVADLVIDPDGLFCPRPSSFIFLVGAAGFAILGSVGIVQKIGEQQKKKKAIQYYNEGLPIGYLNQTPSKELYIGQTQNGAGLVLNF